MVFVGISTIDELFDSPEEMVASIQNEKEYQKLLNEEIGINVVASYHAYVLFEIIEQWSNYLIKTAQNEINENNDKNKPSQNKNKWKHENL